MIVSDTQTKCGYLTDTIEQNCKLQYCTVNDECLLCCFECKRQEFEAIQDGQKGWSTEDCHIERCPFVEAE